MDSSMGLPSITAETRLHWPSNSVTGPPVGADSTLSFALSGFGRPGNLATNQGFDGETAAGRRLKCRWPHAAARGEADPQPVAFEFINAAIGVPYLRPGIKPHIDLTRDFGFVQRRR